MFAGDFNIIINIMNNKYVDIPSAFSCLHSLVNNRILNVGKIYLKQKDFQKITKQQSNNNKKTYVFQRQNGRSKVDNIKCSCEMIFMM